jgi:hypothetical protein
MGLQLGKCNAKTSMPRNKDWRKTYDLQQVRRGKEGMGVISKFLPSSNKGRVEILSGEPIRVLLEITLWGGGAFLSMLSLKS